MGMEDWALHPQLVQDCVPLGDLALSRVLLLNDASYPWLVLVPRRPDLVEIIDLDDTARAQLMTEIGQACEALKRVTGCDKLNVAALGNAVPQLHVHVIARFRADAAWPRPVWGQAPARAYASEDMQRLLEALRHELPLM